DAYVLFAFLPESLEEENGKTDKRDDEEDSAEDKVRSFGGVCLLVQILIEKPSPCTQANDSHEQKQTLHGSPSYQRSKPQTIRLNCGACGLFCSSRPIIHQIHFRQEAVRAICRAYRTRTMCLPLSGAMSII